jgi:hypothetical protein
MTATEQQPDQAVPGLIERGRYAVFADETGHWFIHRAGPLCDTCAACGCGEQAAPIPVPPMVVGVITGQSALPGPVQSMLGKVMGNGKRT